MKVSFGTSCMGRLGHIKRTYIHNITTALNSGLDCEFVLLNWNSQDGLDDWVKKNLSGHIESGIVKYIYTDKPTVFSQSRTKNITLKNSTSEHLCTLDADNFISPTFLSRVKEAFLHDPNSIIRCGLPSGFPAGRIAVARESFLKLRGFDESMKGWGYEDTDFVKRFCRRYQTKPKFIPHYDCGKTLNDHPTTPNRHTTNGWNRQTSKSNLAKGNLAPNPPKWGELP